MEGLLLKPLFNHGFICKPSFRSCSRTSLLRLRILATTNYMGSGMYAQVTKKARNNKHRVQQLCAIRRRRSNLQTDTYVLLEPGKSEEFVSEVELKENLRNWLENWPGKALPPDIARFKSIEDAVSHLVKSVCELEIDGELGSIQWYKVRLE